MESQALNLQKFFKALSVLVVFLVFLSIPIIIGFRLDQQARDMRIKMDMGQLKNWAEVYRLTNKSYEGFENDPDLARFFDDIESMGGEVDIFIGENNDSYCARVFFRKCSYCIDNSGYMTEDSGVCSSETPHCD